MSYIALKPCRFAGQSFKIGNPVPEQVVHPGAVKNLVKMGVISFADAPNTNQDAEMTTGEVITVNVNAEEGVMPLGLTKEGLQAIFDVLTSNVDDAEAIISEMTDGDALILLHISDGRKSIKTAAETRAKDLSETPENPESDEGEE